MWKRNGHLRVPVVVQGQNLPVIDKLPCDQQRAGHFCARTRAVRYRNARHGVNSPVICLQAGNAMKLNRIHHIAIICSDYPRSKAFYAELLGLRIVAEQYRAERDSWKLDLALPDGTQIELFSFPHPPARPSYPEACGLRHLAFEVDDVERCKHELESKGIPVEPVRLDAATDRRFVFFADPDGLPLELYERHSV